MKIRAILTSLSVAAGLLSAPVAQAEGSCQHPRLRNVIQRLAREKRMLAYEESQIRRVTLPAMKEAKDASGRLTTASAAITVAAPTLAFGGAAAVYGFTQMGIEGAVIAGSTGGMAGGLAGAIPVLVAGKDAVVDPLQDRSLPFLKKAPLSQVYDHAKLEREILQRLDGFRKAYRDLALELEAKRAKIQLGSVDAFGAKSHALTHLNYSGEVQRANLVALNLDFARKASRGVQAVCELLDHGVQGRAILTDRRVAPYTEAPLIVEFREAKDSKSGRRSVSAAVAN